MLPEVANLGFGTPQVEDGVDQELFEKLVRDGMDAAEFSGAVDSQSES